MNNQPPLQGHALYGLLFFVLMALLSPQWLAVTPAASASASLSNQLSARPHAMQSANTQITIDPANPSENEAIAITVSGMWHNGCVPTYQFHHVEENTIYLQAVLPPSDAICLDVLTAWDFTVEIGLLPTGDYIVPFTIVMNDGTPISETTARFTVTSASIQQPTATPTTSSQDNRIFLPYLEK